ncbi:transposase [Streptomyces sp. NL15-2K]|uniref:transposase n=1 Tax=Streptomyces sp. NL15-2K TaxID=376149 RepID=UPI000F589422
MRCRRPRPEFRRVRRLYRGSLRRCRRQPPGCRRHRSCRAWALAGGGFRAGRAQEPAKCACRPPACLRRWFAGRYSEELKRDAIARVTSSGRTLTEIARKPGISSESLRGCRSTPSPNSGTG